MRRIEAVIIILIAALTATNCTSMEGRRCRKTHGVTECEDGPPVQHQPREPRPHHRSENE